jgi:hypothetical protein
MGLEMQLSISLIPLWGDEIVVKLLTCAFAPKREIAARASTPQNE